VVRAYQGKELELFAKARNWKGYLAALLRPYLKGDVLEVGAGLGATTAVLCDGTQRRWLCLEPDHEMAGRLESEIGHGRLPSCCCAMAGTVADLPASAAFDAVVYIDVLEHIEADARELAGAARRLKRGGALIVVAPAHGWLYSPFDAAIGHHRRYTKRSLTEAVPTWLEPVNLAYLDSAGLLASAANRAFLRRTLPTARQIATWDRVMIPVSRRLDPWLRFSVGKSVLGVWRFRDRVYGDPHGPTAGGPPRPSM